MYLRKQLLYILPGALLLGVACKQSQPAPDTISFSRQHQAQAFTLDSTAAEYGVPENLRVVCRADILMPESIYGRDISALQDSIRRMAYGQTNGVSLPQDFFRKAAEEFGYSVTPLELTPQSADSIDNYVSAIVDYDGFVSVEGYVQTFTQAFLSYAVDTDSYAPRAAHGMGSVEYVNYDILNDSIFTLADIFTPEGMTQLPDIIKSTAVRMARFIGQTEIAALPSGNNFTITPDGSIVFVYQPYEVASYAQGVISIPVPAYTVDGILTPYGRKIFLNE